MYNNIDEVNYNLERLDLERQIAFEKLKLVKEDYKDAFSTSNLIEAGVKYAGFYGIILLVRRLFD